MELCQCLQVTVILFSCLMLATVWCEEDQHVSQLEELSASKPQKRSVGEISSPDMSYPAALAPEEDDLDKRSSLFRFGKRSTLFRFGKRGSLFRFGKRGSLFRFGKRGGSLFRFGKRDDDMEDEYDAYPYAYLDDEDVKRAVKSFHWGREIED